MGNALHSTGVAFNAVSPGHNDGGGATDGPSKYRGATSAPQSNRSWFGVKMRRKGAVGPRTVFQREAESGTASPHVPANSVAAVAAGVAAVTAVAVGGAVHTGHTEVADLPMNQEGIDVAHVNENGATALLVACADGNVAVVRRLLFEGAPPAPAPVPAFYNSVVNESAPATPLIVACTNGHTECVEALADAGVCVSSLSENDLPFRARQPRKMAPLHIAALHRRMTTFKALMSCGADCTRRDGDGASLLTYAALAGPQVRVRAPGPPSCATYTLF